MVNYKEIADVLINAKIMKDGLNDVINELLDIGVTKDELIDEMGFDELDVLLTIDERI
jgi:hypothetical protein